MFTVLSKSFILNVSQDSEYVSAHYELLYPVVGKCCYWTTITTTTMATTTTINNNINNNNGNKEVFKHDANSKKR